MTRRRNIFRCVEDMVNIGAYAKDSTSKIQQAISAIPPINPLLWQERSGPPNLAQSMPQLRELAGMDGPRQLGMARGAPHGASRGGAAQRAAVLTREAPHFISRPHTFLPESLYLDLPMRERERERERPSQSFPMAGER